MPLLRTTERVFIGYSEPQLPMKEAAERVIASVNAARQHKHIQLYVCEYRQMVVDSLPLQRGIDRVIEDCDLVVLLFGPKVGPGLEWEAHHSFELFKAGRIYKILPYVFVGGTGSAGASHKPLDVEAFYNSNELMYYKIDRPQLFEERFRTHIEVWLAEEERIVERQRDFLRRGLLRHFSIDEVAFSDDVLSVHERDQTDLGATDETREAFERYVHATGDLICEEPLQYYLIARHLRDAVLRDLPKLLTAAEFINPIHQFLAALLRRDSPAVRSRAVKRYQEWLRARSRLPERTRSFAAFQLGMLQAREAAALLLSIAQNQRDLKSVRHYAIYSLGMLRQRSMIVPLMDLHTVEQDGVIRDALINSILYMMGVTE